MLYPSLSKNALVVVAMSGGVDSSTVAAMLVHAGYKVLGITLQLYNNDSKINRKGTCCAGKDIYDAKTVAMDLGIPHYTVNYEDEFKKSVIDDFINTYISGETPIPCVKCNQSVKFSNLLNMSKDLGAEAMFTGHYVRKLIGDFGVELHTGKESNKDQSYFLFATTKEQLEYLYFPLGDLTKSETRNLAKQFKLSVFDKPDSQDICFIPNGNYRDLIKQHYPNANNIGKIIHIDGYELGSHNGIMNYTIGQRRGLGISFEEALYVIELDLDNNIVYVGPESKLDTVEFEIKNVNWISQEDIEEDSIFTIKVRSTHKGVLGYVKQLSNNRTIIKLCTAEKSITPGQACVIYKDTKVVGGGWIVKN